MMPLLYLDSHREKANAESYIKLILKDFHGSSQQANIIDPVDRIKPLDVCKILMGIYSSRANVKRFMNDSKVWTKF